MAVLYISEYSFQRADYRGSIIPVGAEPAVTTQTVAIGGGSVASAAFQATTNFIRLHTDAICSVEFGTAPTATTASARMAAGQTEFFGVMPGNKVAVISNT